MASSNMRTLSARLEVSDNQMILVQVDHISVYECVTEDDLAAVQPLLQDGANLNEPITMSATTLIMACHMKNTQMALIILQQEGLNVNMVNLENETALHAAAMRGLTEVVDKLLSRGAKTDEQTSSGGTPLHLAAKHGHDAVCQRLLLAGATVSLFDNSQNLPLHYAFQIDKISIDTIDKIIQKSPENLCQSNRNGNTPVFMALMYRPRKNLEDLLKFVFKLSIQVLRKECYTQMLNHCNRAGRTMLNIAVHLKNISATQTLLAAGAKVNNTDVSGNTPLSRAIKNGSKDIVSLLLSTGASTCDRMVQRNLEGLQKEDSDIEEMVQFATNVPRKLIEICRQNLHEIYGISDTLDAKLPVSLKNYLNFC